MANLWETLTPEAKRAIAMQAMAGSPKTPENLSRIMEQLAQNPQLVARFAGDAGIEGPEVSSDLEDVEQATMEAQSIDANVDAMLAEEGSMDATGQLSRSNSELEEYVRDLEDQLQMPIEDRKSDILLGALRPPDSRITAGPPIPEALAGEVIGGEWDMDIGRPEAPTERGRLGMDHPQYSIPRAQYNRQPPLNRGPTIGAAKYRKGGDASGRGVTPTDENDHLQTLRKKKFGEEEPPTKGRR